MLNPCSLCSAHCCKGYTITVTAFDVLRICKATGKKHEEFAVLCPARLLSYDPDLTLDMSDDNWPHLLGFPSHPCIFLGKDNLCTIHESAPMSCRRYPFALDNKLNRRFCPFPSQLLFGLKGPGMKINPCILELDAYKKIVAQWNSKKGQKKDCIDFLLSSAQNMISAGL